MAISRALFSTTLGTALGLSLAGCAYDTGNTGTVAPSASVANVNRAAAASIRPSNAFSSLQPAAGNGTQIASLDPMLGQQGETGETISSIAANPPVVQKGTVLWRRTSDESELPPTPKVSEELRRLRESLAQVQGSTSEQFSELEGRLQTSQQTLAQVQDDQLRQERDLRSQTSEAVANVANMAQESMRSMERVARNTSDRWFATNQQLNQLEGRLQTALSDVQKQQAKSTERTQAYTDLSVSKSQLETQLAAVREARQAAMEAELRAKSFTGQQLASRDQILNNLLSSSTANQKLTEAQLQALRETTDTKLAATQQVQGAQFTALSNQLASSQQATASQLQALKGDIATQVSGSQQLTAAQLEALKAETAAKLEGAAKAQSEKLTAVQQMQGMQFAALDKQLTGTRELTRAQLDALQTATDAKLAANRELTGAQVQAAREATENKLTATQELTKARVQALQETTDAKLAAAQTLQGAQIAAVSSQLEANRQLTTLQLAELRKLNDESRALASSETLNVAAALRQYADAQLQQASASNAATIASLAEATDQSVAALSTQTNKRLGLIWQAANANAEKLAEQKANAVAASLAALQQQTAAQKIEPEQIRAIAEQTVADSTPEFRALALKTMQESQDYIRTVARTAVQDKDPAMQTALADAARDVITKDDKVIFAIRKAVAEELTGVPAEASVDGTGPSVRLGPDHGRAITATGETELDPNRLRIAQLLAPGTLLPAPDAAQMASLSPASGPAPQTTGLGGQQSWSTPGTSLMRSRNRADWMDIRQYKVVVHEDDQTLESLLGKVLKHAEPFTGPWQVRWKVSEANRDVLQEKFSLDAETSFEEFVSYLAQYVVNDRGVKLSFSLFDNERIIVISD